MGAGETTTLFSLKKTPKWLLFSLHSCLVKDSIHSSDIMNLFSLLCKMLLFFHRFGGEKSSK